MNHREQHLTYPHCMCLPYSKRVCQLHLDLSTVERAIHTNDLQQTIVVSTGGKRKHGLHEEMKEISP